MPREPISRRTFLGTSTAGLAALAAGACAGRPDSSKGAESDTTAPGAMTSPAYVGAQLYTVRDLVARDMESTLYDIGLIGYGEVEFAGYHGRKPADIRVWLDRAGISAPSAHIEIETLRTDLAGAIAAAKVIGHQYLILGWLPPPKTLAAWRELAGECNRFGEACRRAGLQFAYHNHDFEFGPVEGRIPYDILLEECDPALVKMQLDLYWAVKGGQDPVKLFERSPGRFPLVHVKDMADMGGAQRMVDVGAGEIDFRRIFAHAGRAGLAHYIVEHDEPADPMASLRTSFDNLQALLLARARP